MRVLVTGGAGFIGSHTCEALLARGDEVVAFDNLNAYYDTNRKRQNLREVAASSPAENRFRFVEGDVRDRAALEELVASESFDTVVHLAAMVGVRASQDDPWLYQDVNCTGTLNVLEAVRKQAKPANIVMASTSSVYGRTEIRPFVETDACDRPLAPYAASKRAAELLGFTYHHLYGLDITALRFFTVYGPRGRPDMMAYKVLASTRGGSVVPYYKAGQMHRDWTYVADITQGVVSAADRRLGYECINLGRGEPVLVADFVDLLTKRSGGKPQLDVKPMPGTDVEFTFADIRKAEKLLDYRPQTSAKEGIDQFCLWFEQLETLPSYS